MGASEVKVRVEGKSAAWNEISNSHLKTVRKTYTNAYVILILLQN